MSDISENTANARSWLRALSPAVDPALANTSLPAPASRPTRTAVILERFGAEPLAWAITLGQDMTDLIVEQMPEFGGDPVEIETLRSGAESAVLEAMLWLDGDKDDSSSIPEESRSGNTNFARRNISLAQVLRGVRLGHARLAKGFFDACNELVAEHERAEHIRWTSEVLFEFIDTFSDQMAVAYAKESHRWSISAAAARSHSANTLR